MELKREGCRHTYGAYQISEAIVLFRLGLTLLTGLVVLTGCTGADEVPGWYAEREAMPSCGSFQLDEMSLDNPDLDDANRCLLDAFETGEPAELQVAHMTDEGDPIFVTYRVIGEGELEMMKDTREDDFGNMKFYYAVCAELAEATPRTGPTVRVGDCDYDEQRTFPLSGGVNALSTLACCAGQVLRPCTEMWGKSESRIAGGPAPSQARPGPGDL